MTSQRFNNGQDRRLRARLMGHEVALIDDDAQPEHFGAGQSVRRSPPRLG